MPPKKPSNKIEVDLKLLQDKNAEKLIAFGNKFDTSIDKLKTALDDYAGQLAGAAGMTGQITSTGASKTASVAKPLEDGSVRRGGFISGVNYSGGFDNLGGGPSVAPTGGGGGGENVSLERQYVKAQKRIGDIPVGIRQTLGFLAEAGDKPDGRWFGRDSSGVATGRINKGASRVSDAMFVSQAIQANAGMIGRKMQQFNEFTNYGQDVGLSRAGVAGLPFGIGSAAMREGIKTNMKAMWSGKFGFNMNYSPGQAKHAMDTLNQFGYTGDTRDMMAGQLKQWEIHQRLSPEAAMRVYDPAMRFGNTDLGQLGQTIANLPAQARAAHMNLKEFGDQLTTLAADLSRSGPGTATSYMGQLSAFSAATGLSPDKGAAMLQSDKQTFMAMSLGGLSYAQATIGPAALSSRLKAPMDIANGIARSSGFKDLGALSGAYKEMQMTGKTNPAADEALSSLEMMIQRNPELFGGMTLPELLSNSRRKNVIGISLGMAKLSAMGGSATDKQYRDVMKVAGFGKKGVHGYEVDRHKFLKGGGLDKLEAQARLDGKTFTSEADRQAWRKNQTGEHERAYLNSALAKRSGANTNKANKSEIGLSEEASKWFKIMDKQDSKQNSNQHTDAGAYSNYAMPPGARGR